MNKSQIVSIVMKLVTIGLAYFAGKGVITQEQADAAGPALESLVLNISTVGMIVYQIYRSFRTHGK